jgi:hypothetical protein
MLKRLQFSFITSIKTADNLGIRIDENPVEALAFRESGIIPHLHKLAFI